MGVQARWADPRGDGVRGGAAGMSVISAELTKISLNSYITMKISFTNQVRVIAEQFPNANIEEILDAIGSDSRIGRKCLSGW